MATAKLSIDMDISAWTLREQMAYRKEIGVNPQYAVKQIANAFEGMEGGVVPDAALNIPPEYLVGMAWVTMRRKADLSMDDVVDIAGTADALFEAFAKAMDTVAEEDAAERPTEAGTDPVPETD